MKKLMIAATCIFALSTGAALAQMQQAPAPSSEDKAGSGATSAPKHVNKHMKKGTTTGMGSGATRSSKGTSARPSGSGSSSTQSGGRY